MTQCISSLHASDALCHELIAAKYQTKDLRDNFQNQKNTRTYSTMMQSKVAVLLILLLVSIAGLTEGKKMFYVVQSCMHVCSLAL